MSIRKFGTGEVTGPDDTYQSIQQQREAVARQVEDEHPQQELVAPADDEDSPTDLQ